MRPIRQRRADRREEREERREARRRRTPEVARLELLDAAERLFNVERPDDVGLKDVAKEAGTSHALITHYFGTYAGLVEAVLQRRLLRLRETVATRLGSAGALERPDEMLAQLFSTLGDPVHVRLMKWVMASGRGESMQVFALQQQGLQAVAHQVASAFLAMPGCPPVPETKRRELVEKIELSLVTAVAAALGYALTKDALSGAIGRQQTPELDTAVQRTLGAMLQAYMRELIG
ncbi:MAG TPA: helix-turn-helix domain-containing protein [Kofleriaceae bacterium]|nr:helix-turn-helix domain-containing protein [Kofleriaceae bacterium]